MAHLRIANLTKSYKISRTLEQDVLNGIDAEFNRGEFVAILGESGCGKSTLLNIIAGLDYDYNGSLVLKGEFMKDFDEHQMDDYRKKEVGIIFQSFNLINHMNIVENIMIAMSMCDIPDAEAKSRAKELIEQVGMTGHEHKYPYQLSGGQKQRVAIARALANDPTMILADEPTGNLDKQSAEDILEILKNIAIEGKIVICVTHSEKVAGECTRIIRIDEGLIVSDEECKKYKTAKSSKTSTHKPRPIKTKAVAKISVQNVKQNLKRNLLVTIALGIGIASFVLMLSLSSGIKNFINNEVGNTTNKYQIDVTYDQNAVTAFNSTEINSLTKLDGVSKVIKSSSANLTASYAAFDKTYTFLSVTSTFDGFKTTLAAGDYPLDTENEVLISESAARRLGYTNTNFEKAIGETIEITIEKTVTYTISGIAETGSVYDTAYMSLDSFGNLYTGGSAPINKLYVLVSDTTYISAVMSDIGYLGMTASRQDTSVENLLSFVDVGTILLAGIAAISLIVAAIMIFIVMYTSVLERTKEIGILRAIGARRSDVTKLFLFEAAMIGCAAGVVGSLFSLFIGVIVNLTMASSYSTAIVNLNPVYLILGVFISTIVGVISSVSPAASAANADPIECLRTE